MGNLSWKLASKLRISPNVLAMLQETDIFSALIEVDQGYRPDYVLIADSQTERMKKVARVLSVSITGEDVLKLQQDPKVHVIEHGELSRYWFAEFS